jgi:hypothetical protein
VAVSPRLCHASGNEDEQPIHTRNLVITTGGMRAVDTTLRDADGKRQEGADKALRSRDIGTAWMRADRIRSDRIRALQSL